MKTLPHEANNPPPEEYLRIVCFECSKEVGMPVLDRPAFEQLLTARGWKLGAKPACPDCRKLYRIK